MGSDEGGLEQKLQQTQPRASWWHPLKRIDDTIGRYAEHIADLGHEREHRNIGGKIIPLYARYDPEKEAKRLAKDRDVMQYNPPEEVRVQYCEQAYQEHKRLFGINKLCDIVDASEGSIALILKMLTYLGAIAATAATGGAGAITFIAPAFIETADNAIEWGVKLYASGKMLADNHGKKFVGKLWGKELTFGTMLPFGLSDVYDIASHQYIAAVRSTITMHAAENLCRDYRLGNAGRRKGFSGPVVDTTAEDITNRSYDAPGTEAGTYTSTSPRQPKGFPRIHIRPRDDARR